MDNGYEALLAEVLTASRVFGEESRRLSAMTLPGVARNTATSCVPANVPDGGDAVLNAALSGVLQAAGMATGQLAAVIGTHAQKLQACHDRYRDVEETNTQLMRQLLGVLDGPS